jgi:hypothetical protein
MSRAPNEPNGRLSRPRDLVRPSGDPSVFIRAPETTDQPPRRWKRYGLGLLSIAAIVAVIVMVAWPRLNPRKLDAVERVADAYLKAIAGEEPESARRFGIVEEPPAIRAVSTFRRDRSHDRSLKGSFAPVGKLHEQIKSDFVYDPSIGRFTPKNAMGAAAETLDVLHKAKEDAEKSGLYKKMQSGNPDDLFDAAEEYGKVFTKLAEGALAPKKILPTYEMLVESAKPPLPKDAKALALEVAGSMPVWSALLKRPFQTLKADGPFIYERARVNAMATDRLASLGDPPSRVRLELVRFRLEGIDTGWKVVTARRILPGDVEPKATPDEPPDPAISKSETIAPGEILRSPGESAEPQ